MRLKKLVIIFIISTLIFVGCSQEKAQKPNLAQGKVGALLTLIEEDIAEVIKITMEEEAKKQNVNFIWFEPTADLQEVSKKIDEIIKENLDAVIIQLGPNKENSNFVTKLMEEGIYVITMGIMPEQVPLNGHITPDFKRIGELQGSYLVDNLVNKKGQVVIYSFEGNDFKEIIDSAAGLLKENKIKFELKNITWNNIEKDADLIARELSQNTNISGVIFPSSELALKGVMALDTVGRDVQVATVGLGASKMAVEAIEQGLHDAEIDYMPQLMARNSIMAAAQLIDRGQWDSDETLTNGNYDVPAKKIPVRLITQENTYLLEERFKLLGDKNSNNEKSSQQINEQGIIQSNPMMLIIETKAGETIEVEIPKPIATLDLAQSEGGGSGGAETPMVLNITTIEGQKISVDIPGEIKSINLKQKE